MDNIFTEQEKYILDYLKECEERRKHGTIDGITIKPTGSLEADGKAHTDKAKWGFYKNPLKRWRNALRVGGETGGTKRHRNWPGLDGQGQCRD